MPYRTGPDFPNRTTAHFLTFAAMPSMVFKACEATGTPSNTRYMQEAVCARLSKDLGIPLEDLLDRLPPGRAASPNRVDAGTERIGPANTIETVR